MPAPRSLSQQIEDRIKGVTAPAGVRVTSARRLAVLVTGIVAARHCGPRAVAAEVTALGLTAATRPESVERRLRRARADDRLEPAACSLPAVREAVAWPAPGARVGLVVDESRQDDRVHLLRLRLAYRGGSLPLAWRVWQQHAPLPAGESGRMVEEVLGEAAALLPPDAEVVIVADRADDVPAFVDRVAAHGWHWIVRGQARGTRRFRDDQGRDRPLAGLVARHVPAAGRRWKARGAVFKKAGWREASVVAIWGRGEPEPGGVRSDLPPRWAVLREDDRRFWIEPGFRADKSRGWRWEECRVRGVARQGRLLLALAWASLVVVCLGVAQAGRRLAALTARAHTGRRLGRPQHARDSLFALGLRQIRAWLYGTVDDTIRWLLPGPTAVSWTDQWVQHQVALPCGQSVRP